jgi:serine protease Do
MRLGTYGLAALAVVTMATVARPALSQEQAGEGHAFFFTHGRGHLGIALDEVNGQTVEKLKLKEERGALVREVRPDSPAAKAGFKVDDVIVAYQGLPVESALELTRRVRETPAGRTVTIEIVRQGGLQKLSATLDESRPEPWQMHLPEMTLPGMKMPPSGLPEMEMPPPPGAGGFQMRMEPPSAHGPQKLGIGYQEISGQFAEYFKVKGEQGLLVVSVTPDGPAAKAGVKVGDIVVRVGNKDVASGGALQHALAEATPGEELSLTVQRDGRPTELKVVVGGSQTGPRPPAPPAKTRKKEQL